MLRYNIKTLGALLMLQSAITILGKLISFKANMKRQRKHSLKHWSSWKGFQEKIIKLDGLCWSLAIFSLI
ncbi:hypothetical protein K435DRAFT_779486 [Dendrothele bispora CBS 962.96]|uniref:Uncharacterized protein n=1 Tax=Dendrothele bispora (strain CBS 962.96) TaxID=1314807 RepID=A0A4S8LXN5_DENBC|nr:hypothetical protein K435DRAFT_779486 [Dendrothele bispora CBS 962.96]